MLLLRYERLPEGPDWLYELKLDGYRTLAIKSGGRVQLGDFNARYPGILKALRRCQMKRSLTARWWRSIHRGSPRGPDDGTAALSRGDRPESIGLAVSG
jgi:hypothetical protein